MFELLKTCFVAASTLVVGDAFIDGADRSQSVGRPTGRPHRDRKNCNIQLWNGIDQYYLVDGRLYLLGKEHVILEKSVYDELISGKNEVI